MDGHSENGRGARMIDCAYVKQIYRLASLLPHSFGLRIMPAGAGLRDGSEDGVVRPPGRPRQRHQRGQSLAGRYAQSGESRRACA